MFNLKETLAAKVTKLEALEIKVQQQEELLMALQSKQQMCVDSVSDSVETRNLQVGKNVLLRTFRETCAANHSLTSGMYGIDPDGQGVGDDPINDYTATVQHDFR